MREATNFIKSKMEDVAKILTLEHHRIIQSFIYYKE